MASNQSGGWQREFSLTSSITGFVDSNWMIPFRIAPRALPERFNKRLPYAVNRASLSIHCSYVLKQADKGCYVIMK